MTTSEIGIEKPLDGHAVERKAKLSHSLEPCKFTWGRASRHWRMAGADQPLIGCDRGDICPGPSHGVSKKTSLQQQGSAVRWRNAVGVREMTSRERVLAAIEHFTDAEDLLAHFLEQK